MCDMFVIDSTFVLLYSSLNCIFVAGFFLVVVVVVFLVWYGTAFFLITGFCALIALLFHTRFSLARPGNLL